MFHSYISLLITDNTETKISNATKAMNNITRVYLIRFAVSLIRFANAFFRDFTE